MRTGKPNDIKHKLEELKEIPEGFQFDQHTVWQRLESRLTDQVEKRKKPYGILVLVAATALLFIFLELWFIHLFGNMRREPLEPMNAIAVITAPESPVNISQKDIPVPTHLISNTNYTNSTNYTKDTQEVVTAVQVPPVNDPVNDTVTATAKTTTVLSKKGFPVAHINELSGENPLPLIIPAQGKTKTASLFKKKAPVIVYDAPSEDDEKIITRKKPKGFFN